MSCSSPDGSTIGLVKEAGGSPLVRTVQNKCLPWSISEALSGRDSDSANGIREGCI